MRKIYEQQHPEIYDGMSEEDKEALRLGRELLAKRKEEREKDPDIRPDTAVSPRTKKSRKSRKFKLRVCALVAVMVMTILAVGITSVGGPQHLAEMVDSMFEGRNRITINSQNADIKKVQNDEESAYQRVKDELGFEPIQLGYKPEGMEFYLISIDTNSQIAYITYESENEVLNVEMMANYTKSVSGIDIEDKLTEEYTINVADVCVIVKEFDINGTVEKSRLAYFDYDGVKYIISGMLDEVEFNKIIKNIKFLD